MIPAERLKQPITCSSCGGLTGAHARLAEPRGVRPDERMMGNTVLRHPFGNQPGFGSRRFAQAVVERHRGHEAIARSCPFCGQQRQRQAVAPARHADRQMRVGLEWSQALHAGREFICTDRRNGRAAGIDGGIIGCACQRTPKWRLGA